MENLNSLQDHREKYIAKSASKEPLEGVSRRLDAHPSPARIDGTVAIDLVNQAAEVVRCIEERAKETEQHANNVAQNALEKLLLAETRIQELMKELTPTKRTS
jgi:hypothetical protein